MYLDMFVHGCRSSERLIANWAFVRLLTGMCTQMLGQCARFYKATVAVWANERFLTCVSSLMRFQMRQLAKSFLTHIASEWLFLRMCAHVLVQTALLNKSGFTIRMRARKSPIVEMNCPYMIVFFSQREKSLTTHATHGLFVAAMATSLMHLQLMGQQERLIALRACVQLFARMDFHVRRQIRRLSKCFVARGAREWFLLQMDAHVHRQITVASESFIAHSTNEWPIGAMDACVR